MSEETRRVLVTGGAGFIGSHVADAYLNRGDEVWIVDDLSSGRRKNIPAGATFLEADIG
jgi:UDP-glucose 4-epimerase